MSLANYRPRGIGEILDATFTFYRANFATILTVAMLVVAPPAILKVIAPKDLGRALDILGNLVLPIGQGAIAAIVAAAVERREVLNVGDAFRSAAGRTGSLIAVQLASGLLVFIGLILLVIPGVIAVAWTAVGIPVVMIEHLGYSKAIDRSRALARGRFKYVLGTLLLSWVLALLLMIGVGAVAAVIGSNDRIIGLLSEILFGVVFPVPAIAMTLLYYDLRVRNEGAELEAMLSELPAASSPP